LKNKLFTQKLWKKFGLTDNSGKESTIIGTQQALVMKL